MNYCKLIIFLIIAIQITALAQDTIVLENPSFEGSARCCIPPNGWNACEEDEMNTPDTQPGFFSVELWPFDGETYLGMVTRNDNSWESISQKLSIPFQKDTTYQFSIYLAKSTNLISQDRVTPNELINYNLPARLRIWGGNKKCKKDELIATSPLIDHNYWKKYEFILKPYWNWKYITFEVYYNTENSIPYCGNILMDNCSKIIKTNHQQFSVNDTEEVREEEMILSTIIYCNEDLLKDENNKSYYIHYAWEFDKQAKNKGIQQFMFTSSRQYVTETIHALKQVQMNQTSEMLDEINLIWNAKDDSLSEEQINYFKNIELTYKSISENEKTLAILLEFINDNKQEITEEIKSCH